MRRAMKGAAFALLPAVALLLAGELGARALLFVRHGYDPKWFIAPFGWERGDRSASEFANRRLQGKAQGAAVERPGRSGETFEKKKRPAGAPPPGAAPGKGGGPPAPVEVFLGPARWTGNIRFEFKDACGGRILSFRFNRLGYRGGDWRETPPGDAVRILALGGSSTLGVTNPEDKTWPAILEKDLRGRLGGSRKVEVLNAGRNAERLDPMISAFRERLYSLDPRLVIYYGGYNEAAVDSALFIDVGEAIDHLNKKVLPWFYTTLYSRSMLYTVLLEKYAYWRVSRSSSALVPDVKAYVERVKRLAEAVRRKGEKLLIVIQENRLPRGEELESLDLKDADAVRRYVSATGNGGLGALKRIRSRIHHILMEALRRLGPDSLGPDVRIVDPASAFAGHSDRNELFCDPIHLTDKGNATLARFISGKLSSGFLSE